MKTHILCGSGSPRGIIASDIYGNPDRIGIGGAELALFTLCEAWKERGDEVVIYNDPRRDDGMFDQRPVSSFEKSEERDVLVIWREPNELIHGSRGLKVWFSTDQFTVGDYAKFSLYPDRIVTISPHHSEYFRNRYGIQNSIPIDLPVRVAEYEVETEKVPNRLIFTSVPDRGVVFALRTLSEIRKAIPDVSMVVTSDFRLWGVPSPLNSQYIQPFIREPNLQFLGAVNRRRLVEEQLKAQILYYPCTYEELFCIACAEAMTAGVLPITTTAGALKTTSMGVLIDGEPKYPEVMQAFVENAVKYLQDPNLMALQNKLRQQARQRFSPQNILSQWDERVFDGR